MARSSSLWVPVGWLQSIQGCWIWEDWLWGSVCAQGLLWTGGQGLIRATHNHPVPTAPHTWQSSAQAITEAIYSPTTAAEWARPIQFLPWREGKTRWMDVTYLKSPVLSLDTIWTTAVMAIWWHRQNTFIMLNAIDKECKTKVDWLALDILHYCFESTYSEWRATEDLSLWNYVKIYI